MNEEIPPDHPWNGVARRFEKEHGWDFARTYDCTIVRYLQAKDTRPLVCLILQGRVPGPDILKYFAAMFDRDLRKTLNGGIFAPI
ncbi:hypothetical protein [Methylocella sp.]|jgi:hypothetical protein|uniref:hypothetical protein n=1 Tax=Methylocella sp. TaxID=1978226 RepID=UPI003C1E1757